MYKRQGNAIVEGGEILYDGQDLLKISEDDFYRLRGDKIAMIFQDPLSSLNPIMRIGKQLTEAMLLKGKARQRSSRENFHGKLNLLEKFMQQAPGADAAAVKEKCDRFRKFEMKHIELEQGYNNAAASAREALEETNNILFLIEKNAFKDDCAAQLRQVKEFALHAENPFVVSERAEAVSYTHLDVYKRQASAYEWYESVNGVEIQATNVDTKEKVGLVFPYSRDEKIAADRLEVLAALEGTILQNYDFIPLSGDATAHLKGMQIEYHTEEEVFPMGYGGLKYITYNYDDAAWDAYVAEQGGTLNYK